MAGWLFPRPVNSGVGLLLNAIVKDYMRKVVLLLLLLISAACSPKTTNLSPAAQPSVTPQPSPPAPTIVLRKGQFSPIYSVSIYADGTVIFEGTEHTRIKGKVESKISPEKVEGLITEFEKAGYFSLADRYVYFQDCPQSCVEHPCADTGIYLSGDHTFVTTSVNTGQRSKTIVHYYGCENKDTQTLTKLEDKIDEVANTKQWVE